MSVYQFDAKLLNSPTVTEELSGGRLAGKEVDLELSNADGAFTADRDSGALAIGNYVRLDHYLPGDTPAIRTYLYGKITAIDIPGPVCTITVTVEDPDSFSGMWPAKVYSTDDWAAAADGAPYDVNGSTKINPSQDLGRVYPVSFGRARKVRAVYVYADYDNDEYYYIINRGVIEATNADKGTKINVYRNKRLVGTSEYTVYDGSQASPFAGYAYIRFAREQSDGSNLYEITVDLYGLEMGGATAERNPANILEWLLSDATVGLGESVNAASFAAAATTLSTLGGGAKSIYIDGGVDEQLKIQDLLDHLAQDCARSFLYKNSSDEWCITTDTYQSTSQATFGRGDGQYRNIIAVKQYSTPARTRNLTVKFARNAWTDEFAHTLERAVFDDGEDVVLELPLIQHAESADLIACYLQRREQYALYEIDLDLGMEARDLVLYQPITVVQQWQAPDKTTITNINGQFQVRAIDRGLYQWSVLARTNSSDIYTYSAGDLPTDPSDDALADYSFTPPSAPTGLAIASSGTRQGTDGGTYAYYRLSCTPPAVNCQHIEFGYKEKNAANYQWLIGEEDSGTWYGILEGLIPGQLYYFAARAVNNANASGYTQGALAEITSGGSGYTAPGDTTPPGTITYGTATVKLKTWRFPWTKSTAADIKDYHVQISTSSSFTSTVYDGYVGADYKEFTYDAAAYGTTLYARVKGRDHTGNESASWSGTMSATCSQIVGGDITTGAITATKISVSTLSSIAANVGTLTAGVIQSGAYSSGVKIDLDNGYIQIKDASDPCLKVIDSTNNVNTFLWAGNTFGSIGVYGYTSALLKFGVSAGGSTWGYYADRMVLSATALYPETTGAMDLGTSSRYWGDMYVCDGWYLYKDANNIFNFKYGSYRKLAIDDTYNPTSGQNHGCIYVGDVVYAGALNSSSWTLDIGDKKVSELISSCANAYAKHDGKKLDPILQKSVELRLKDKNSDGNFETVITKSLDDFVQLAIMGVNELYLRVDALEKK